MRVCVKQFNDTRNDDIARKPGILFVSNLLLLLFCSGYDESVERALGF